MSKIQKSEEGKSILGSRESIIYVLDRSGSMQTYLDEKMKSKLNTMKDVLRKMLEQRIRTQAGVERVDKIGLLTFGGQGWSGIKTVLKLRVASNADLALVDEIKAGGNTPMFEGLTRAVEDLDKHAEGLARIVLMSDGVPTGKDKGEIEDLVRKAAEDYGIILDTVGIGNKKEKRSLYGDIGYDEPFMRKLAEIGKGEFYDFSDEETATERMLQIEAERRALVGHGIFLLPPPSDENPPEPT